MPSTKTESNTEERRISSLNKRPRDSARRPRPKPINPVAKSLTDYLRTVDGRMIDYEGRDNVAWHVSGGLDFAPITTWAEGYETGWKQRSDVPAPGMHIYTCLGNDHIERPLMNILESKDKILFHERNTKISIEHFEYIKFGDIVPLFLKERHADFGRSRVFASRGADGFFAHVLLENLHTGYQERTRLLYLLGENINTLDYFVENHWVTVRYLAAECEGNAMGGCRRSIFHHLNTNGMYRDNPHFSPRFLILPARRAGTTYDGFRHCCMNEDYHFREVGMAAGRKGAVHVRETYGHNSPAPLRRRRTGTNL